MQHISQIISHTLTAPKPMPSDLAGKSANLNESCIQKNTLSDSQKQAILANIFEPVEIPPEFMLDIVGKLFLKFKDRYRNTMITGNEIDWGRNKTIEWADYFNSKNATIDELRQAYVLCKDAYPTFPPNEVEFLALARKNRHTDSDTAMRIAVEMASQIQMGNAAKWENAVIFEAAMRIGCYTLTHEPSYLLEKKWHKTYQAVCDEVDAGAVFAIPQTPMIEQVHTPVSNDRAKEILAGLTGRLHKNPKNAQTMGLTA